MMVLWISIGCVGDVLFLKVDHGFDTWDVNIERGEKMQNNFKERLRICISHNIYCGVIVAADTFLVIKTVVWTVLNNGYIYKQRITVITGGKPYHTMSSQSRWQVIADLWNDSDTACTWETRVSFTLVKQVIFKPTFSIFKIKFFYKFNNTCLGKCITILQKSINWFLLGWKYSLT